MSLETIFETAFTQRIVTPEMEHSLNEILWSRDFNTHELNSLAALTDMLEAGEIALLAA